MLSRGKTIAHPSFGRMCLNAFGLAKSRLLCREVGVPVPLCRWTTLRRICAGRSRLKDVRSSPAIGFFSPVVAAFVVRLNL